MKVLIVDDDPGIVTLLSEWLSAKGHEPTGITRGIHTQQWVANRHFDLVLMDIQMPDSDGINVMSDLAKGGTRVVVMSGLPAELWTANAMLQGAYDCLPKPISLPKLDSILAGLP